MLAQVNKWFSDLSVLMKIYTSKKERQRWPPLFDSSSIGFHLKESPNTHPQGHWAQWKEGYNDYRTWKIWELEHVEQYT